MKRRRRKARCSSIATVPAAIIVLRGGAARVSVPVPVFVSPTVPAMTELMVALKVPVLMTPPVPASIGVTRDDVAGGRSSRRSVIGPPSVTEDGGVPKVGQRPGVRPVSPPGRRRWWTSSGWRVSHVPVSGRSSSRSVRKRGRPSGRDDQRSPSVVRRRRNIKNPSRIETLVTSSTRATITNLGEIKRKSRSDKWSRQIGLKNATDTSLVGMMRRSGRTNPTV